MLKHHFDAVVIPGNNFENNFHIKLFMLIIQYSTFFIKDGFLLEAENAANNKNPNAGR